MAITVTMPEVAETIVEGTIAKWLKQPGERVEQYESLVEIVTDKVNVELPSPADGVITEILVAEGETVAIGTPLMVMEAEGEAPVQEVQPRPVEGQPPAPPAEPVTVDQPPRPPARRDKRYSPLVLKLAEDHGVDLNSVQGTGVGGRVTKADVLQYVQKRKEAPEAETKPSPEIAGVEELPVDPVRRAIAQRMLQSVQQIP
ncbi:MAG: biotin/lipoyl-containing protein, partial [Dehalococcoidia bacterium]